MGLTRAERMMLHKKQERLQVITGVTKLAELKDGVPVVRFTADGLVEYIKYKGVLHKKQFS